MADLHRIRGRDLRGRIAQEAARILAERGAANLQQAKLKAASRLGVEDARQMPSNQDVEAALAEYQRLFHADETEARLRQLRETASKAMALLAEFSPRATGAVATGVVTESSVVSLQVFADAPEEVLWKLQDAGIPHDQSERRWRPTRDAPAEFIPVVSFLAGDTPLELTVLPHRALRHPASFGADGRPQPRLDPAGLAALIAGVPSRAYADED